MVELKPMTEDEFHAFFEYAVQDYAEGLVEAGNCDQAHALETSRQTNNQVLLEGWATPGQSFCSIWDQATGASVGSIWYGVRHQGGRTTVVLYVLVIFEQYRRKGFGAQALRRLEESVRALGLDEIRLYVFGHNRPARALYEKMGYTATSLTMARKLDG
jgi:ribosomal protein S18 acetylase RimI-like enzyme